MPAGLPAGYDNANDRNRHDEDVDSTEFTTSWKIYLIYLSKEGAKSQRNEDRGIKCIFKGIECIMKELRSQNIVRIKRSKLPRKFSRNLLTIFGEIWWYLWRFLFFKYLWRSSRWRYISSWMSLERSIKKLLTYLHHWGIFLTLWTIQLMYNKK